MARDPIGIRAVYLTIVSAVRPDGVTVLAIISAGIAASFGVNFLIKKTNE